MDENILIESFDLCGLTSLNPDHFHRQLRHFVENNEFVEDLIDENLNNDDDMMAFIDHDGECLEEEDDFSDEENGNDDRDDENCNESDSSSNESNTSYLTLS